MSATAPVDAKIPRTPEMSKVQTFKKKKGGGGGAQAQLKN